MYTAKGTIDQQSLLDNYLPMIQREAQKLQARLPSSVELDDLVQAGTVGFLEAASRYEENSGASLKSFAYQRIRGAMIDELRSYDWMPRKYRRHTREVEASIRKLEQKLGRTPDETEIAQDLNMDIGTYQKLLMETNSGQLLPLDLFMEEGYEPSGQDHIEPFKRAIEGEKRMRLVEAINKLPEREKTVLTLHYQEEMNLREIGLALGVSESRACQLHGQAVSRLRAQLHDCS